ncbi:MAG: hypothetical protein ACI8PZ_006173 [Myxococcota bacterium]|jgi:hypothetical protein
MSTRGAAVLLLLVGCDDHVFPTGEGGGPSEGYTEDWEGVQLFLGDTCLAGCHEQLEPVMPAAIEDDLLGGLGELVVPGDSAASLLWQAIDQSGNATPMPIGQPRLSDDTILHVKAWIDAGAEL